MIPSYGVSLMENPDLLREVESSTAEVLGLTETVTKKTPHDKDEKELVYN